MTYIVAHIVLKMLQTLGRLELSHGAHLVSYPLPWEDENDYRVYDLQNRDKV